MWANNDVQRGEYDCGVLVKQMTADELRMKEIFFFSRQICFFLCVWVYFIFPFPNEVLQLLRRYFKCQSDAMEQMVVVRRLLSLPIDEIYLLLAQFQKRLMEGKKKRKVVTPKRVSKLSKNVKVKKCQKCKKKNIKNVKIVKISKLSKLSKSHSH